MNLHTLQSAPTAWLADALEAFEAEFRYPLGPGRFFRISHGRDYPRFFRAMGEAVCFVAEREERVLGVLGLALRRLLTPDGQERAVVYLGDLKIAPTARSGHVLLRLARVAGAWIGDRADAAFGVVMDGTRVTPETYTGRLGIPLFQEAGKVAVLRLDVTRCDAIVQPAAPHESAACYARLSAGRFASHGGNPSERAESVPTWLRTTDACGLLEDTQRAKRLIADDGADMRSAHLSCFAYRTIADGSALLRLAGGMARQRGFPAIFVAVAAIDGPDMVTALAGIPVVVAPATVFAAGLTSGPDWNINTAEI